MSSTAGPGTPIEIGLLGSRRSSAADRRHERIAALEVDQQDSHHARLGDPFRVGPQPSYVPGVSGRHRAHRMSGRGIEREIRGPLAHQLPEAAAAVEHQHSAAPVHDDGIGVHHELARLDEVEVVGQLAHTVRAVAAAVRLHQRRRHPARLVSLGAVRAQKLGDPALEGFRLDHHP